jgi:hypothetical protein
VWDLWLDCLSDREIEAETGVNRDVIHDWVVQNRQMSEWHQPASRQHQLSKGTNE